MVLLRANRRKRRRQSRKFFLKKNKSARASGFMLKLNKLTNKNFILYIMISNQTYLNVADNSGPKELMVIHVFKNSAVNIGDKVIAVVKDAIPNMALKKGAIVTALIVRTKKGIRRKGNSWVRFQDNAAVIVQKETGNPRGSRIFGVIPREIKNLGFTKIIALAPEIV